MRDPWFRRQLLLLSIFPAFGGGAAAIGAAIAADADAWLAYAAGLAVGFVAIAIEFETSRRRGRLFLHDRREVQRKRWRNRALARWSFAPAAVLVVLFGIVGGSVQAAVCGLIGGYLLPLGGFLFVHFFLHHDEIRGLTASR